MANEAVDIIQKWYKNHTEMWERDEEHGDKVILLMRPISMHPDDWYLSVVVAHLPDNQVHPYATWTCNIAFGEVRLHGGNYFKTKDEAFRDWLKRS